LNGIYFPHNMYMSSNAGIHTVFHCLDELVKVGTSYTSRGWRDRRVQTKRLPWKVSRRGVTSLIRRGVEGALR